MSETMADRIKALLNTGLPDCEVASRLGCKPKYVADVKWMMRNNVSRRDYWRTYSGSRYATDPAFRKRKIEYSQRYRRHRAEARS